MTQYSSSAAAASAAWSGTLARATKRVGVLSDDLGEVLVDGAGRLAPSSGSSQ